MPSTSLRAVARAGLLVLASLSCPLPALADNWVTAEDVAREAEFMAVPAPPRSKLRAMPVSDPDLPRIEVLRPNPLDGVKAPFGVELRFAAREGSAIDPDSLRVAYGFMGIDLTERIRRSATVTPAGLRADNVEIPRGDHRLTVRIADLRGRVGEREIRIRVGE